MISCEQHDYIEIACTYRYAIKVMMKNGVRKECVALDTQLNEQRQECVKVLIDDKNSLIVLDDISSMEAMVDNHHFRVVSFT